jgi:RNA polymerase sigma-70 factor, ECF subfamily
MTSSEETLLQQARTFDPDSLGQIYDAYSPGVYRYAMRLLGDAGLAEDCVSETFQRFLLALKSGGGPHDHIQAYLYRIAHNWITDQYRRQPPPPLELREEFGNETNNPAHSVLDKIDRQQVRTALVRLSPDQRQVITFRFLEGLENEIIAQLMNRPVGAVKALQHRALETLKHLLLPEKDEEK